MKHYISVLYAENQVAMDLWSKLMFCMIQHVIFVGIKIKSDLLRYNWSCGVIRFNSNSIGVLGQVSIVSHFSNLIFIFFKEVSFLLGLLEHVIKRDLHQYFYHKIQTWSSLSLRCLGVIFIFIFIYIISFYLIISEWLVRVFNYHKIRWHFLLLFFPLTHLNVPCHTSQQWKSTEWLV